MTVMVLKCPHCERHERLEFADEDTFIALGEKIGPDTYEALPEAEHSVFEAARIGWEMFERANRTIEALAAEYDRVVGQLEALSGAQMGHGPFVGSASRSLFHRPECKWAEYFLDTRSCLVFETHEQAVAAGRRPCRSCCA